MDLDYIPWDDPEDTASTKAILKERIKGTCATRVQRWLPSVGQSREHDHRAGLVHPQGMVKSKIIEAKGQAATI